MGEGMTDDAAIMPYISSVNIACGYHAGDEQTMRQTVELALQHGVAIGAHPGFADKKNFGRKEEHLTEEAYCDLVSEQLHLLQQYIDAAGAVMHHVKPHGALYNMSAKDKVLAAIIAKAVKDHDPALVLYGLSNSYSITEAVAAGLQTASEAFADRTYTNDGSLTPRTQPGALIDDEQLMIQQTLQLIRQQAVTSVDNKIVPVKAETICIHGDGPHALAYAIQLNTALKRAGIRIKAI
jgi:UPF0271 protein